MARPKKHDSDTIALDNLAGFIQTGARAKSETSIPTGYFELDFAINFGVLPGDKELLGSSHKKYDPSKPLGIPCGRVVEIFGEEGAGKSSICHRIAGQAQKMGYKVAWIDTEQSYSEDLAIINGVDMDSLLFADMRNKENPDELYFAEDVMDNIIALIQQDVKLIVLDSVASLVPKFTMESGAEQQSVALLARLLSQNIGKICQWAGKKDALVLFVNQLREKPGVMFGNPITTPGGRALKFHSSLRISLTKRSAKESLIFIEGEDGENKLIGRNSGLQIVKNRFAKPLLDSKTGKTITLELPIYYEPYFPDLEDTVFNTGRQFQLIRTRAGVFTWTDAEGTKHSVEGRTSFMEHIREKGLLSSLIAALREHSEIQGVPLPPEIDNYSGEDIPKRVVLTEEEVKKEGENAGNNTRTRKRKNTSTEPEDTF